MKATVLNNFFTEQTLLDDSEAPNLSQFIYHDNETLSSLVVTPTEVKSVLRGLPLNKASGPNSVNNRILRELSTELSLPLCDIFNTSLRTSVFPEPWKEAFVTPIFKSGDSSNPANYRPISLLSTLGKVFERIVFKHTFNFLHTHQILSPLQSGFVPGDSTINQLTFLYNFFSETIDSGKEVRAIFCDISKAFDRVWHKGLLFKLTNIGIRGSLLSWFESYLTNRKQKVVIPNAESNWSHINAGVPQGSILGPLLFLIFINDIVKDIHANIRLFADDTSLYVVVDNPVNAAAILNSDLERINKWAKTWLVCFNPKKTESMIISRKTNTTQHPPVYMDNVAISEVTKHKHLGLYFTKDLKWGTHIEYIV